jgi:hypothetical protein
MSDIKLKQNDTEYLLYVPPSEKARAKSIEGCQWDARRRCWAYPKTRDARYALLAEFGDDITAKPATKPKLPTPAVPSENIRQQESAKLEAELGKIREILVSISKAVHKEDSGKVQKARAKLASSEKALEACSRELIATKRALASAKDNMHSYQDLSDNAQSLDTLARQAAMEATGNDMKFFETIGKLTIDESLPIQIAKHLEWELRKMLNISNRSTPLSDLLAEARDSGALTKESVELAHIIRIQRNALAHGDEYKLTYYARILLCLFAAALIWPELPE